MVYLVNSLSQILQVEYLHDETDENRFGVEIRNLAEG